MKTMPENIKMFLSYIFHLQFYNLLDLKQLEFSYLPVPSSTQNYVWTLQRQEHRVNRSPEKANSTQDTENNVGWKVSED